MNAILKRLIAVILSVTLVMSASSISILALTRQEQEDFYRVNTKWQNEYNLDIDWLLESDNFLYHLDITEARIIKDIYYDSLNLNPKERKDNFVEILSSFIGLSYDDLREETAGEVLCEVTSSFLDGVNNFMEESGIFVQDEMKGLAEALKATSEEYLSSYYGIDTRMEQYSYYEIFERIENNFDDDVWDFDWPDRKDEVMSMFMTYVESSDWHKRLSKCSDVFSIIGDGLSMGSHLIAFVGELESYNRADEKFVELLKYIKSRTTDNALKYACDEIIAKFGYSYTQNIAQEALKIFGEGTIDFTIEQIREVLTSKFNIYAVFAEIGISAGNVVSDMWFNSSDMKKQMQAIYCINEISELMVGLVKEELECLYDADVVTSLNAALASDTIYHMNVLIETRKIGEKAYYKLKDSAYSSAIITAIDTLGWGNFSDDQQVLEDWYLRLTNKISDIESFLYKSIPQIEYDYIVEEESVFEIENFKLVKYNGELSTVYLPANFTNNTYDTIASYAFANNQKITLVDIPYSVNKIESNAFYNCENLNKIVIHNNDTIIMENSFVVCSPELTIEGYSGSNAEKYAIKHGINFVALDNQYQSAQDYNDPDFLIKDGVLINYLGDGGDVYVPYGVTSIGGYAFYYCRSLASVTLPDSVTSIGGYAFYGCRSLASVTLPDSVTSIGGYVFYGCRSLTSVIIPDSVTSIGNDAFYGCSSLSSITIGDSVTSIRDYVFYGCSSLTCVIIPNSVRNIGVASFDGCSSLVSITIPDSVTSIGNYAFYGCSSLASITIPDSVTSIGNQVFDDCNSLKNVIIPDSVTSIGNYAFDGCSSLASITIPNSVTSIGNYAFYGCSSLTSVIIPNSVISIGDGAFGCCGNITKITIGNSVTSIGDYALMYCSNLTSVTIGDSVTSIGNGAFYDCSSLISINIPDSVTSIGDSAFDCCWRLTSITLGDSVTSIGNNAFYNCSKLTSVTIPDSVTSIGDYTFYNCSSLASVTIGNGVTSIGGHAFYNCKSLTSIDIPAGVTSIGDYAFRVCKNLTDLYYSGTETQWNEIEIGTNNEYLLDANIHFVEETYDVTFIVNGEVYETVNGVEGAALSVANPTVRGYIFKGWATSEGGSVITLPKKITGDATYYAVLQSAYIVTFHNNYEGAEDVFLEITNVSGKPINVQSNPVRANYDFMGWATTANGKIDIVPVTISGNADYYAVWSLTDYYVNFDAGYKVIETIVEWGETLVAPGVSKSGCNLLGWSTTKGGEVEELPETVEADTTFYAVWKSIETDWKEEGGVIVDKDGELYYQENGKGVNKGLFFYDGAYYFTNWKGKITSIPTDGSETKMINIVNSTINNTNLPNGWYEFGADGGMLNGIVEKNGTLYYYVNGKGVQKGLFEFQNDYYYSVYGGRIIAGTETETKKLHMTSKLENHTDLPTGWYEFGTDGKMIHGVVELNGEPYYYEYGKGVQMGLFEYRGGYYYSIYGGKIITNKTISMDKNLVNQTQLGNGQYEFGADGKALTGIVEKNGNHYYYENGRAVQKGLIKVDGKYYYTVFGGKIA